MSDSRSRFEAWTQESPDQLEIYTNGALKGEYCDLEMQYAWRAWQAAEAETARRCEQLIKDAISRWPMESHYSAGTALDCIRREFPEAWK